MAAPSTSPPRPPFARRFRLLKAYGVTLRVLMSYLMLKGVGWVRGPDWVARTQPERHRRNARRVVQMILELKGLFIKIGQLISILTNFLPKDFRQELEALQDRIPPRPMDEITARIRAEFARDPADLFASFETVPLASASLAQVHEAYLHDGTRVAVKVQHADIEAIAQIDLRTIRHILGFIGMILRVRGLTDQYRQLETMIYEELDFAAEARHIEAIAANFPDAPEVGFPGVIHDRSSQRVLTTTFVEGAKVTDLEALDAYGLDRNVLAERIVVAYCRMIFTDGLYHADPHPGNLIVQPDGRVVFIDFGAVARLSPEMKSGIPQFLMGVLRRDTEAILQAFRQMGFIARNGHEDAVHELLDYLHANFLSSFNLDAWQLQDLNAEVMMEAKMEAMADFWKMDVSFRELIATFQVPKDWILLQRTVLLLIGLCTHLNPSMNPINTIRPYLEEAVLGPEKNWKTLLTGIVKEVALSAMTLPDEMRRVLIKTNRGELTVEVKGVQEGANLLYVLGHQLLYGLFALGTGTLAYVADFRGDTTPSLLFTALSAFFALCLGVSFLRARRWRRRG